MGGSRKIEAYHSILCPFHFGVEIAQVIREYTLIQFLLHLSTAADPGDEVYRDRGTLIFNLLICVILSYQLVGCNLFALYIEIRE